MDGGSVPVLSSSSTPVISMSPITLLGQLAQQDFPRHNSVVLINCIHQTAQRWDLLRSTKFLMLPKRTPPQRKGKNTSAPSLLPFPHKHIRNDGDKISCDQK